MEVLRTAMSGVPVLKVSGDVDHLTASALEKAVQEALGNDGTRLLLDLSECPYMDSAGLSVLLFACRQVSEVGWLGALAPNPNLIRLFEIVGLTVSCGFRVFSGSQQVADALNG